MKSIQTNLLVVFAIAHMILPLTAAPQAPDLSGTWSGPLVTNDNQSDAVKLILIKKGSSYRGTVSDELGIVGAKTEIIDAVQKDDTFAFAFFIVEGGASIKIRVALRIGGDDKMMGRWEDQQNGTAGAVELVRAK